MVRPWRRGRRPESLEDPSTGAAAGDPPRAGEIDRLIVQQHDPNRAVTIGGIDTCLRGVLNYAPPGVALGVVGIDTSGSTDRPLGRWQRVQRGERQIWFLPVARIDTTRPKGYIPYSARLIAGLLRYRSRIPRAASVQAHRVDVGLFARLLFMARSSTASTPRSAACSDRRPTPSGASSATCTSGWTGRSCGARCG